MNEHRSGIIGTLVTWGLTVWTWYEQHTPQIVGLFAILASCVTMYLGIAKARRKKLMKMQPSDSTT